MAHPPVIVAWRVVRRARALALAWCWAWRAGRDVRRALPVRGLDVAVRPPPGLPAPAGHAVLAALRLRRSTCLERSMVLQTWLASQGRRHDVVVGVLRDRRFGAHAWVSGVDPDPAAFSELVRVAPPDPD